MTRIEFLLALQDKLSGLGRDEVESRLEYFSEMIDDRIEEGMTEAEAIEELGSVDKIAEQIIFEVRTRNNEERKAEEIITEKKSKIKKKRSVKAWEITLIILGAPLWLPLLIAAFAFAFGVFVSFWAVVISVYAVIFALALSALVCILCLFIFLPLSKIGLGIFLLGAGLILAGTTVLVFIAMNKLVGWILKGSRKIVSWIKNKNKVKEAQ